MHGILLRNVRGQERTPGRVPTKPELDRLSRQPPGYRALRPAAG